MFRTLRADEIECRVQSVKDNGLVLLLYKDARCDMNILDETVGPMMWKREHSRENANCTISIYNKEIGEWISKEDTGTESNTEKEKGLASSSFKRAATNWGIGRELYTSPFIWIEPDGYTQTKDGKVFDRFQVTEIGYDKNRNINRLVIKNVKTMKVVFTFGERIPRYKTIEEQAKADGVSIEKLLELFKLQSLEDMTEAQCTYIANNWTKEVIPKCVES